MKEVIFHPSTRDRTQIRISRFSPSFLVNKDIVLFPFVWTEYF